MSDNLPLNFPGQKYLQVCCCIAWTPQVLFMSLLQTTEEVYMGLAENSRLIIQNSHTRTLRERNSKPGMTMVALDTGLGEEYQLLRLGIISASLGLTLLVYRVGRVRRSEIAVLGSPLPLHTCRLLPLGPPMVTFGNSLRHLCIYRREEEGVIGNRCLRNMRTFWILTSCSPCFLCFVDKQDLHLLSS